MPKQYPAAVAELRTLGSRRRSLAYLHERITEIESAKYSINASTASATPTTHGGTRYEDRLDSLIMDCDAASAEYAALRASCYAAEAALAALTEEERVVLELCYTERHYSWAAEAAKRLHISQCTVYRIRDTALEHYATARGMSE